jgi:hypothetical protein
MVRAYGGRGRPALVTHSSAAAGSGEEAALGAVLGTAIIPSPYGPAADLGTGAVHQPGAAAVGRAIAPPPASVAGSILLALLISQIGGRLESRSAAKAQAVTQSKGRP